MPVVPSLLAFGTACYGVFWLRYRLSGGMRLLPDQRPLWFLVLAALAFAALEIAFR